MTMRFLAIILFCMLTSCIHKAPEGNLEQTVNVDALTCLVFDMAVPLYKDKHLFLEDSNAYYSDMIDEVSLKFSSQNILEVKEARDLLVDLVEDFLKRINSNPHIASQFAVQPVTADVIEIDINFQSYEGRYVDPFYVGYIKLKNGYVSYLAFDFKDFAYTYTMRSSACSFERDDWHGRYEPYYKSLKFVQCEREAEGHYEHALPAIPTSALADDQYIPEPLPRPRTY